MIHEDSFDQSSLSYAEVKENVSIWKSKQQFLRWFMIRRRCGNLTLTCLRFLGVWGPVLADKTVCMSAKHHDGKKEYDMHSLFGWSQTEPTYEWVNQMPRKVYFVSEVSYHVKMQANYNIWKIINMILRSHRSPLTSNLRRDLVVKFNTLCCKSPVTIYHPFIIHART